LTSAHGQVTFTGTLENQNLGSQAVGTTSAATSLSFSVAAGTTVGSIAVFTQGATNLDFNSASGGTCAATSYSTATACTVDVNFKPSSPGQRLGAIAFFSAAGNTGTILGSVAIYGIGTGSQLVFGPPAETYAVSTVNGVGVGAVDLAEDSSGNVFVAGEVNSSSPYYGAVEYPANGGSGIAIKPSVLLANASSIAVDGVGNIFIADSAFKQVVVVPKGGGASTVITLTVDGTAVVPAQVRVDGLGDLFIRDDARVIEVPANGGTPISIHPTVNGQTLFPDSIAVDAAGNLFIDQNGSGVYEVPVSGAAPFMVNTTVNGLVEYGGLALDPVGDLFITVASTRAANELLVEIPLGGTAFIIFPGLGNSVEIPSSISVVDAQGNYAAVGEVEAEEESNYSAVFRFTRPKAPSFAFKTVTQVGLVDTTDGIMTAQVQNIGNVALSLMSLAYPPDFTEASGDSNACATSTTLNTGTLCDLPIEFSPEHGGALSESVTLPGGVGVAMTGTGLAPSLLTFPATGFVISSANQTFNWTASPGATYFDLLIGTTQGAEDIFVRSVTGLSTTANSIPLNGETVYVTLITYNGVNSVKEYYSFATGSKAALTAPSPNGTLPGPNVTFNWATGTTATGYALWLGTTGAGSYNLLEGGVHASTSLSFNGIPAQGGTLYARLWTVFSNGTDQYTDYQYTEAQQAVLTSPSPGSLIASNVTFTWNPSAQATGYALWLGTTGVGSYNLLQSGVHTGTSQTVNALPANGQTIYARLFTSFNGVLAYTDYTFTGTQAVMTYPVSGSTLIGPNITFTWSSGGSTPTGYALWLGTTGVGSHDLLETGLHPVMSYTFDGLPTNGETIYARLWTSVNGALTYGDYSFTTAQQAQLVSPAPGSTLAGSAATFAWTTGVRATGYALWLGTTGPGSHDLLETGVHPATSYTVGNLPTNGSTIYVRLYSSFTGPLAYTDYTYVAAP
jgi:hypothetical protein